ncbi:uridine kinase [Lacticaseibacillus baoqingensis]|uniref:Uridine kinase n=1 Tax=Lacticaseibacillus baoqingensis TaxID=2486013 RepID=A0ABW4E351_9LACO|nr:uridine kinase [Lacticaseibacillus baoqingensis]
MVSAKPIVIGITGGSASGKTSVAKALCRQFASQSVLLQQDNYYKHSALPFAQREKINYDHPDAFDDDLLVQQLKALIAGKTIQRPVYDYQQHNRTDAVVAVASKTVIIVEGILVLADPALRQLMDIKVFVDTDADVRVLRRIQRDIATRGRSLESVIAQYLATVKPAYHAFIAPTKRYADIIIPEGGQNRVAVDLLSTKLQMIIQARSQ